MSSVRSGTALAEEGRDIDRTTRRVGRAAIAVLLAVLASGCVGGSRSGSDQPGISDLGGPAATADPAHRESLNESSEDDISAALRRSGVADPQHWAQVLVLQRPYPAGAPGAEKIRQVLVERQADPQVISGILGAVEP